MTRQDAYKLFDEMILHAKKTLVEFTKSHDLNAQEKEDKTLVTECDKAIDIELSNIAKDYDLNVVSEEGEHLEEVLKKGNYITIDPIDGTNGYIEYVKRSGKSNIFETDLGAEYDFGLLLGIVEDGIPQFAALYNYVTHEKILLDSSSKENTIRENDKRIYDQKNVLYVGKRGVEDVIKDLAKDPEISLAHQSSCGLKSVYIIINQHENAMTIYLGQSAGIWDILPAVVAAKAYGGELCDGNGDPIVLNQYVMTPGKGLLVIKGEKFKFVVDRLKNRFI